MLRRPILYLDLDDTVISWASGSPRAATGGREFILWALEQFEVRWLTTWCPSGIMDGKLLHDLARMLEVPVETLREIEGFAWDATATKLNGIAWLEHLVLGRPFVWLEDQYGFTERERVALREMGMLDSYVHCNVSEDERALLRAWEALEESLDGLVDQAA
jgi:hypothetical protein